MSELLNNTINDCFRQVVNASSNEQAIGDVLRAIKAPILEVATPDVIAEVMERCSLVFPNIGDHFIPRQGYIGSILIAGGSASGIEIASSFGPIKPRDKDPVQKAFGKDSCVPMVGPKAFRALAHILRPESARDLSLEQYMGRLDLTLGCAGREVFVNRFVLFGTTCCMPTVDTLQLLSEIPGGEEHLDYEKSPAFKGSGFADQYAANLANGSLEGPLDLAIRTREAGSNWN